MTAPFTSTYNMFEAFRLRVEHLRGEFGGWDSCDPVAHRLLDFVEAQNEIAALFLDEYGTSTKAAFRDAVEKRRIAGERLMQALNDRDRWPNPNLGKD